MHRLRIFAGSTVLLFGMIQSAEAHLLGTGSGGATAGFLHPLTGFDHLLAMVAAGVWAMQIGGRARWLVPLAFATMVAVGGALGMGAAPLPYVESGIAVSVVVLGGFILVGLRPALGVGLALVGGFALLHGHAHGTELPESAAPLLYATGFLIATILLHGLGMGIGTLVPRLFGSAALRSTGGAVSVAGALLLVGIWST